MTMRCVWLRVKYLVATPCLFLVLVSCASTPGQQLSRYTDTLQEIYKNAKNSCYTWLAAPVKPALSIETNQQKIIADDATRTGDYQSALSHYLEGLKQDPCWPEGYFNAALLMASRAQELHDNRFYGAAAGLMGSYLGLSPTAPDADAAYEKIIVWIGRAHLDQRPSTEGFMSDLARIMKIKNSESGSIGVRFAAVQSNQIEIIYAGGPGAQAGLMIGDIVTTFDGKQVSGPEDITAIESPEQMWGSSVPIEIVRNGKAMSLKITIGRIYYYTGVRAQN